MSGSPTPVDELGQENRAVYDRLVEQLASGKVQALVGAGLSARLGYPAWKQLLKSLKIEACSVDPAHADHLESLALSIDEPNADLLVLARQVRRSLASRFPQLISAEFGLRTPAFDCTHQAIVRLPLRHILTTNYDPALAEAHRYEHGVGIPSVVLGRRGESEEFIHRAADANRTLVFLHGSVEYPDEIVLELESYNRFYQADTPQRRCLETLVTLWPVMFVGFSFTDVDLMERFRFLAHLLPTQKPRHFAILSRRDPKLIAGHRESLCERYRVEVVYYDPRDGYALLPQLLEQLVADVRRAQGATSEGVPAGARISSGIIAQASGHRERIAPGETMPALGSPGPEGAARTAADAEIDTIFELTRAGHPERAIGRYRAMLERGEGLTDRLRYRIHANIGNSLYRMNDEEGAAGEYTRAVGFYRESSDARALEAFASLLRGDKGNALRLSTQLCMESPDFPRAHVMRVRSLPGDTPFAEIESSIPETLRADGEVALVLAHLAYERELSEACESYARAAAASDPELPQALGLLAGAILFSERRDANPDSEFGLVPRNPERVTEAERLLTEAIRNTPATDPSQELPGLLMNRALARKLLQRGDEGRGDVAEAFRLSPSDPQVARAEAEARFRSGDHGGAVTCLEAVAGANPWVDHLLASNLEKLGAPEHLQSAIAVIRPWARRLEEIPEDCRADVLRLYIRLLCAVSQRELVHEVLDGLPPEVLSPIELIRLRAGLALLEDDREVAVEFATEAEALVALDTPWFDRREVALLAHQLELWPQAFRLWRGIVKPTRLGVDARYLLNSATRAGEDGFVLEFCRQLRAAGVHERDAYKAEAEILFRYREPQDAIDLLQAWLHEHPDDREIRLHCSVFARRAGLDEQAEDGPDRLPAVESIEATDLSIGAKVVYVLRHGANPIQGLDYAYEFWRRFPNAEEARGLLMQALFDPQAPLVEVDAPVVAGPGCAALIKERNGGPQWVVLETGADASLSRSEYPPDHPLTMALAGKRSGEAFEYSGRLHDVVELRDRRVFRAQECLNSSEMLFPQTTPVRRLQLNLEAPTGTDLRTKLGEVWPVLESQDAKRRELEGLHRRKRMPLSALARAFGRPVFDLVRHFATNRQLEVCCSLGLPEEMDAVGRSLRPGREVILDGTAVATIFLLRLHYHLKKIPLRLVVPQAVLDELREVIADVGSPRQPRATLGLVNGRPVFQEYSAKQLAHEMRELERLLSCLTDACEVIGGQDALKLDPQLRAQLIALLGHGTAHAIAAADARKTVLWTDDLFAALVAQGEMEFERAWTHAVVRFARSRGSIAKHLETEATGKLLVLGYSFTSVTNPEIIDLLRGADWRTGNGVGLAICRQAVKVGLANPKNRQIYARAVVDIWSQCPDQRRARRIVMQILNGMSGRSRSPNPIATGLLQLQGDVLPLPRRQVRGLRRVLNQQLKRRFRNR